MMKMTPKLAYMIHHMCEFLCEMHQELKLQHEVDSEQMNEINMKIDDIYQRIKYVNHDDDESDDEAKTPTATPRSKIESGGQAAMDTLLGRFSRFVLIFS